MRVIGTAGHIDHGKSSLVLALTGTDPDRLPEEKARGMTIELGFANLTLPLGDPPAPAIVGVVDVPGHERFVRHMLAGVGGIDLALLVVAADEAVMPQTREHLAILDLLDVQHGVVALTKSDLVEADWLALVSEEVRAVLAGSSLAASPIVPCSSITGAGLPELRATLARALGATPARPDRGRPHLPIDRVFTLTGFGTVVTGTLLDGTLSVGQEVEFSPAGMRARIRGLQSHHSRLESVGPGRRVAVNVAGVAVEELSRGMVLCLPDSVPAAQHLDLRLRVPPLPVGGRTGRRHEGDDLVEVTHNMTVMLHTGAAEGLGSLRLLQADRLGPGEEGWAQVRLEAPLAVLRGDRVVLRVPSPASTVAGGIVVAINPQRHNRRSQAVVRRLEQLLAASPEERLLDVLAAGPATASDLAVRADLQPEEVRHGLAALESTGMARPLATGSARPGAYWIAQAWLDAKAQRAIAALTEYHARYPLRRGMSSEALREMLGIERRPWADLLEGWRAVHVLQGEGDQVWAPFHTVQLNVPQERAATALLSRLAAQPYAPPTLGEMDSIDPELLASLLERGDPVRVTESILLRRAAYEEMRDTALRMIDAQGQVTVGMLRDTFGTSRKFALALLEHLDDLRLTRRLGDARVRGPAGLLTGGRTTSG